MSMLFHDPDALDLGAEYESKSSPGSGEYFKASIKEGIDWGTLRLFRKNYLRKTEEERLLEDGHNPLAPLTEEDWKLSGYYREGMQYQEGMTLGDAAVNAEMRDRDAYRHEVLNSYTGANAMALNFSGQLLGGLADPVNYLAIPGAMKARTALKAAKVGFAENAMATMLVQPFVVDQMKAEGQDAGWSEVVSDLAVGGVLGATMGLGTGWLNGRADKITAGEHTKSQFTRGMLEFEQTGDINSFHVAEDLHWERINSEAKVEFEKRKAQDPERPNHFEIIKERSKKFSEDLKERINHSIREVKSFLDNTDLEIVPEIKSRISKLTERVAEAKNSFAGAEEALSKTKSALTKTINQIDRQIKNLSEVEVSTVWTSEGPEQLALPGVDVESPRKLAEINGYTWDGNGPIPMDQGPLVRIRNEIKKANDKVKKLESELAAKKKVNRTRAKKAKEDPSLRGHYNYASSMLKSFLRYNNDMFIVYDEIGKRFEILNLSKENISSKRYKPVAGWKKGTGKKSFDGQVESLVSAMLDGHLSLPEMDEMWNRYNNQYRNYFGQDNPGNTNAEGVHIEEFQKIRPGNEKVSSRKVAVGDNLFVEFKDGSHFLIVDGRFEAGEKGLKGGKTRKGGFWCHEAKSGVKRQILDGTEAYNFGPKDRPKIYGEGAFEPRVMSQDYMDLYKALYKRAVQKAKGKKSIKDPMSLLSQEDFRDVSRMLKKERKNALIPNHWEASGKNFASMGEPGGHFDDYISTLQSMTEEDLISLEESLDFEIDQIRSEITKSAAKIERNTKNGTPDDLAVKDYQELFAKLERSEAEKKMVMDHYLNRHTEDGYAGYDPTRDIRLGDGRTISLEEFRKEVYGGEMPHYPTKNDKARQRPDLKEERATDFGSNDSTEKFIDEEAQVIVDQYKNDPEAIRDMPNDLAEEILGIEEQIETFEKTIDEIWKGC